MIDVEPIGADLLGAAMSVRSREIRRAFAYDDDFAREGLDIVA